MKLDLAKKEFEALLKLVYLGGHISHARRIRGEEARYWDGAEQAVFSQAGAFGCGRLVRWCEQCTRWHPSQALYASGALGEAIEHYKEDVFWDELAARLAERDFVRAYAEEQIEAMSLPQQVEREESLRGRWEREFDRHGLERLDVARRDELDED